MFHKTLKGLIFGGLIAISSFGFVAISNAQNSVAKSSVCPSNGDVSIKSQINPLNGDAISQSVNASAKKIKLMRG